MRMNQQFRQRQNGFGPKQKISKTNDSGNSSHGQRNQSANSTENKQAFKPVTILKRGDPSGTTIVTKDENQSKENIGTNGQSSKPVSYRVRKRFYLFFFARVLTIECRNFRNFLSFENRKISIVTFSK